MVEVVYLGQICSKFGVLSLVFMRIASNSNFSNGYLDVNERNHSLDECNVINESLPIKDWERKRCRGWTVA